MKKKLLLLHLLVVTFFASAQNVGIGITTPVARLHVADSNVLFTGPVTVPVTTAYYPPAQGAGTRMMWYPQKAAFRVGNTNGDTWDFNKIGPYSIATGFATTASGYYSTAIGAVTTASGDYSTAMGASTTASGNISTAMGGQTTASGEYSTAMGSQNAAYGNYSTAMGRQTSAFGDASTTMGRQTTASGYSSTAIGYSNVALGDFSTVIGAFGVSSGDYSIAIGDHTTAKSYGEVALGVFNTDYTPASATFWSASDRLFGIGNGTISGNSDAMVVLKNGNVGIGTATPATTLHVSNGDLLVRGNSRTYYLTDAGTPNNNSIITADESLIGGYAGVLIKGNNSVSNYPNIGFSLQNTNAKTIIGSNIAGIITNSSAGSETMDIQFTAKPSTGPITEYMRITSAGNVGIGNSSPNAPLAFTNVTGKKICLYESPANSQYGFAVQASQLQIYSDAAAAKISFGYYNLGTYTERMYLTNSTGILTVAGTNYPSDARYKKQITRLQSPIEKIMAINGVEYFMRTDEFPSKHFDTHLQVGLIAQEVEKVLPQAVQTGADGYKAVDYARMVPLLVEGIKEQQHQIDELKKLLEKLLKQ